MSGNTNLERLKAVNQALSDLGQEFVFVGGSVISLYADRLADEIRPTDDVDVLVEVYTRIEYSRLEDKLRVLGFKVDTNSKFIGRFVKDDLIVDFMPLEKEVLGFNNQWYIEGFKSSMKVTLDSMNVIRIFTAPYFLAAKLEAFNGRGKNTQGKYDGRFSTDFEDIVFVLVNRETIWNEIEESKETVKSYLKAEFKALYNNPYFEEWIDANSGYGSPAARAIVLPRVKKIIGGSEEAE